MASGEVCHALEFKVGDKVRLAQQTERAIRQEMTVSGRRRYSELVFYTLEEVPGGLFLTSSLQAV